MEQLLLTPLEAAQVLRVGRSKVYSLLAKGELRSVRVGHSIRVPADELREWVRSRSTGTGADRSE
jgi:excisionase family DNA binding protein